MTSAAKKFGSAEEQKLWLRVSQLVAKIYRRPSDLDGREWADTYRYVAGGASPGKWKTKTQPVATGPLIASTDPKINTVIMMVFTQGIKTEDLMCSAFYYIHQDPSDILWVFPTQDFAAKFSKGRFKRNVDVTPVIRELISRPKYRGSENTITHVEFPGGMLDFSGANSPTDLSSRPIRVLLLDEIDKYPASAANMGDPVRLAIERASTFAAQGRAKVIMACSPTVEGFSRIGKEYANSDQRKCFLTCPHCGHAAVLTWTNVRFDKDESGNPLPKTAQICCEECGVLWTERERIAAIDALLTAPGYGWRQTRDFTCCSETQVPECWDHEGRSLCRICGKRSAFDGRAGFNTSKIYSKRHQLSDVVQQWMDARGDEEQMHVFRNEAMAEQWQPKWTQIATNKLLARAEIYGPQDLPKDVKVIMAGVDTHPNRLEVQIIGFGYDEETWVIAYFIIPGDPVQMAVWQELDRIRAMTFRVRGADTILRINAMGVDMGGCNTAQVLAYCNQRRGSDVGMVFATRGQGGPIPIWPPRSSLSKVRRRETFYNIGVDSAKELICARLAMDAPEPGFRKPGYIHFPLGADNIDAEYMAQLAAERQIKAKRSGQEIRTWEKIRERNEAFDTMVIALAVRRRWGKLVGSDLRSEAVPPLPQSIQPSFSEKKAAPVEQPSSDEGKQLEALLQQHPELREDPELRVLLQQIAEAKQ